jgi:hypothetical protein|tara:strand:- start:369 stop:539 length:171 start_codon:yes stop_codon:yes gene_type:complete
MALVLILITGFVLFKLLTNPLKALSYLGVACIALILGSLFWLAMFGLLLHANGIIQ